MTVQKQRHARAMIEVQGWKITGITAPLIYQRLNTYAADARMRDYTPHLITACRLLDTIDLTRPRETT